MKPLVVLLGTFVLAVAISKFTIGSWNIVFSGNLSMSIMLCFTALGHFMYTNGMAMMLPAFIPMKKLLVYLTGIAEIILGILLVFPRYRLITGLLLIVFLMLMLPANIKAALKRIDFEKATYEGKGISYLWFRIPLQIWFMVWVYIFAINNVYLHL